MWCLCREDKREKVSLVAKFSKVVRDGFVIETNCKERVWGRNGKALDFTIHIINM